MVVQKSKTNKWINKVLDVNENLRKKTKIYDKQSSVLNTEKKSELGWTSVHFIATSFKQHNCQLRGSLPHNR